MSMLPRGRGLTIADLEAMPEDGQRYELIDGVLLVSPAPTPRHQIVALRLWRLLEDAAPPDLWVLAAPLDVVLGPRTMVEPDVLVAPRAAFDDKRLPSAPLLAVEVLSPSSTITDLNVKFARYERAGVASYWVLDPIRPSLIAWELRDGAYVEVAEVADEEPFHTESPFLITVVPAALLD